MKTKAFVIIVAFLIAGLWLTVPAMAQMKGHTGGTGETRIHFNTASAANLAKAPGITPAIADAIVKYRGEKPIKKGDDLLNVPGITADVLKQINPQVGTEGDLFTVPKPGETLDEEEGDVPLAPSKC